MFRYEKCSHQAMHYENHDRNMFILIMIETTSRGIFDHDQTKRVKNGGLCGGRRVPKRSKIGPTVRRNAWLKHGTMERYGSNNQRREFLNNTPELGRCKDYVSAM